MATFDYAGLRATTLAILLEFGDALALTRAESGATYDPETGTFTGGTSATLNGVGVLVSFSNREIDGTAIRTTDKKLIFQGDALQIGDTLNGWRVHEINDIDPDSSGTILTIAQMRR